MNYNAQNIVWGEAFLDTILGALKVDPGAALLIAPKVRLTVDPAFNPQPNTTLVALELNEAAYTGYAAGGVAPTLSALVDLGLKIRGFIASTVFIAGTADPQLTANVTGYWIDNGAIMVCAERFANGLVVPFGEPGAFLALQIALGLGCLQAVA